jgi:RHS repeat-associated protein
MTDGTGAVVWSAEYKPFSETISITGTITNNLRFPGRYFDAETGLNYNYYREYNPIIGRYVEADPIGLRRMPMTIRYNTCPWNPASSEE